MNLKNRAVERGTGEAVLGAGARAAPLCPPGFTLIELLVVIGIIGVLVAILLPAVQAVRESGRRAQCTNNLRQIGVALLAHHTAKRAFPAGNFAKTSGVCPGASGLGPNAYSEDQANWAILILPYLEEQPLFDRYNFDVINEDPANQQVRETAVAVYTCPSDPGSGDLLVPADGPAEPTNRNVAYRPGSYRGVSGRSGGTSFADGGAQSHLSSYTRSRRGPLHVVGVLGYRPETLDDLFDGSSTTLLVGESMTRTQPEYGTLWAYSHAFYSLSAITKQARVLWGDYQRCCEAGTAGGPASIGGDSPCQRGWGSLHPGGLSFVFCDGSVHFVAQDIDLSVLGAMATIAGGEQVDAPW